MASCSVNKYLPEGEKYYNGAEYTFKTDSLSKKQKKTLESSLDPLLRPIPNKKILGWRYKVWFYHKAGEPKKDKGFKYWLRNKMGEEPVYMSDVNTERTSLVVQSFLENKGYFQAKVVGDTIEKTHEGIAEYDVKVGARYRIREVHFLPDSSEYAKVINESAEESLLIPGAAYDFDIIKNERERIDNYVKENGYYLFSADYLLMRIDSNLLSKQVDIFITVKRETPPQAKRPWYIKDIFIYSNYDPSLDSIKIDSSFWHKEYYIIDPKNTYKPKVFDRTIFFQKGEEYNRTDHNQTLNRLVNVGTFRFVRNRFEELPITDDSARLNVYYYLVNAKKRSLRTEATGKTTSANFNGIEFNLNFRNRNTFKSAEQFFLKVYGGFDVQFAGQNQGYNIYRVGTEGGIIWPRFVPFKIAPSGPFVPHTKLSAGYEWQNRQRLYTLTTIKSSFGWAYKTSITTEHDFNPFNLIYVNSRGVSDEYMMQIGRDSNLARIIEEQLIIGPSYDYIYTNTINYKKRNAWYYKGHIETSGNIPGLIQGADAKAGEFRTLLDVRYSQYIKTDHDLRFYRRLSSSSNDKQWVNRLNIGLGLPYGNSLQLPFIKQFFTGGSNNLRAFRVRSVGPGTYRPVSTAGTFLPDMVGDIKLEMNSEFRTKLFSIVHGALFVDAGNVWLYNENPGKPGGKFTSQFLKELAVGAGFGIRLDIAGIFMLRLDLGIPMRKPWLPDGERWVIGQIDPGDAQWRKENLVLNLAVGLPF